MSRDLNTRQWEIYKLIKKNTEVGYTGLIEIADTLCSQFVELNYNERKVFHNSTARRIITKDIKAINNNDVIQKVIISTTKGVKLLEQEDARVLLEKEKAKILKSLSNYWKKVDKIKKDGQLKITWGNERDTIEAFYRSKQYESND